ncbi:MAG: gene transfer agent family protein [Sphingomonadales bacterium]|nr:MAG: gene transfer agent family protein [Sphingomonadales bacterium]TNF02461.1 MAG: gene transfer agent family protein [Sphingomonadales bacterium]
MSGGEAGRPANKLRGEAEIILHGERLRLRPSFEALVAAEEELGPLFALVERASAGELRLTEMVALFWHCRDGWPGGIGRAELGEAVAAQGLAATAPVLKAILRQILAGNA